MRERDVASGTLSRSPIRARTIAWSLTVGILVGCAGALWLAPPRGARFEARQPWSHPLPGTRDWPRTAREGESVLLESRDGATELVVTAASAHDARSLVRAFVTRHEPLAEDLASAYARTRQGWRDAPTAEPTSSITRNARCAAVLLARTRWGRDLSRDLPLADPEKPGPEVSPPPLVEDAWLNVTWVVDDRNVAQLRSAVVEATKLDAKWFADPSAWSGWTPTARAEAWRDWQRSRAKLLAPIAQQLLEWQRPKQDVNAARLAALELVMLDEKLGDPWASFATRREPARPLVRPLASAWLPPLLVGAGAGSLAALLALLLAAFLQPAMRRPESLEAPVPVLELDAADPALHIVAGLKTEVVLRAAMELAARRLAAGDRVLLVDGSPRHRFHDRLEKDPRWGLLECLATDMPMLGLVQYAGHPGLYLLPYGKSDLVVGWSPLGQKLDEVLPHFGRIVLALDPKAPAAVGDALRGRPVEGWWVGAEANGSGSADSVTTRLGIAFRPLYLQDLPQATLEALGARVTTLRPASAPAATAPIALVEQVVARPLPKAPLEPIVLDCDLQVIQRVRFLAWMRRVQAEEQRA